MRRIAVAALIAAATLVLAAAPALAHEEITPSTIATGKPTFFILTAANEKSGDLTKVVLTAPAGTSLGSSVHSPAGWTAAKTDSSVTWTGGKVAPDNFDQWGFEIEGADQPGTLNFKVTLTAGGDSEDVTVPVTVVAGSGTAGPSSTSPSPTVTASPTTAAPATTPTTVSDGSGASGAAGAALASTSKQAKDAKDRSSTAIVIGVVALLLAIVAIVVAFVARSAKRGPGTPAAATPQDF